jgi:microcystin-dependent protein
LLHLGKSIASKAVGIVLAAFVGLPSQNSFARSEPFLGELMITGMTFCPRGWVEANGQLLSISQHQSLFSLYGTTYGGDGRATFALPDLQGRVPVHTGQGPGLKDYLMGQKGGQETTKIAPGSKTVSAGRPTIVLRYCVAYRGIFPSRN